MDNLVFPKQHAFYVALKNGHTYAFSGDIAKKLENNHIIITEREGKLFLAAFALSEVAYAVGTSVYYDPDTMAIRQIPSKAET